MSDYADELERIATDVEFEQHPVTFWSASIVPAVDADSFCAHRRGVRVRFYADDVMRILHELGKETLEIDEDPALPPCEELAVNYFYDKAFKHLVGIFDEDAGRALDLVEIEVFETHGNGGL